MSLKVVYSKSVKALKKKIFSDINEILAEKRDESIFLLVPEDSKVEIERAFIEQAASPGIMNLEILSFDRFCFRILDEVGLSDTGYIDTTGQTMLIYRSLKSLGSELKTFKTMSSSPGFVSDLLAVIGEMKRSLISPEELKESGERADDFLFKDKILELSKIMALYDEFLRESNLKDPRERYGDALRVLSLAVGEVGEDINPDEKSDNSTDNNLKGKNDRNYDYKDEGIRSYNDIHSNSCSDNHNHNHDHKDTHTRNHNHTNDRKDNQDDPNHIHNRKNYYRRRLRDILQGEYFIYGFGQTRDFTRQEYALLEFLGKNCSLTVSAVCGDSEEWDDISNEDYGRYKGGQNVIKGLLAGHKNARVQKIDETPFSNDKKIYGLKADDFFGEIKMIAGKIRELVGKEGFRYRDIYLMSADFQNHKDLIKSIFRQSEIPFYIGDKKTVLHTPPGIAIASLFKVLSTGWRQTHLMSYLKSGFADTDLQERDDFENFVLEAGIKYKNHLYNRDKYEWYGGEKKDIYWDYVMKVFASVNLLEERFAGSHTVGEFTQAFKDFLQSEQYDVKSQKMADFMVEKGFTDEGIAIIKAWNLIMDILDQISLMGEDTKIDFHEFSGLLKTGMDQAITGTIPHFIDCVQCTEIGVTSGIDAKVLFVSGMDEDNFPGKMGEEGLLNDYDRQMLSHTLGVKLPSQLEDKVNTDSYIRNQILLLPSEYLFLSWSASRGAESSFVKDNVSDVFEEKTHPSPFDIRICNYREGINEIQRNKAVLDICSKAEGMTAEDLYENNIKTEDITKIRDWLILKKLFLSRNDTAQILKKYSKTQRRAQKRYVLKPELVSCHYGEETVLSISQLENYSSCPFMHFATYILNLKERKTHGTDRSDFGSILHHIVEMIMAEFVKKYRACDTPEEKDELIREYKELDYKALSEKSLEEIIEKENYVTVSEAGFRSSTGRNVKRIVESVTKTMFSSFDREDFMPGLVEWTFSPKENNPLVLDFPDGREISFRGKVDRVDLKEDEFIIVDYKSGNAKINESAFYYGLSLQLPVYMEAFADTFNDKEAFDIGYLAMSRNIHNLTQYVKNGLRDIEIKALQKEMNEKKLQGTGYNKEVLKALGNHSLEKAKELSKNLLDGVIGVTPRYIFGETSPCTYCKFASVCGVDKDKDTEVLDTLKKKKKDKDKGKDKDKDNPVLEPGGGYESIFEI